MPSKIPLGINKQHILEAIYDLDTGVPHRFADSTKFDLLHEGRRYPPKAVVGLAAGKLLGSQLGPYDFKGGEISECFRILRTNGFQIVRKDDLEPGQDNGASGPMPQWVEDVVAVLSDLGGIGSLNEIYGGIRSRRAKLSPTFEATVRRTLENNSSDSITWTKKRDLFYSVAGLGNGSWGLRSMLAQTPKAEDLNDPDISGGNTIPSRSPTQTYRILRDTFLCQEIKSLYKNKCQLCGHTITLAAGETYSEAHHIIPLGRDHNGPDVAGNIIVVCPNHHAMLDYAAVELDLSKLIVHEKHVLSSDSIAYHNEIVRRKRAPAGLAQKLGLTLQST